MIKKPTTFIESITLLGKVDNYTIAKKNCINYRLNKVNEKSHAVETIGILDSNELYCSYGSPLFVYIDLVRQLSNFMIFMLI